MFEKTLSDLIQGLRANKRNETEYIQRSLSEIQHEVQQSDMRQKSVAVDKLNYLHMLGYDMNWASFNVVEVMASSRFGEKRAGYLAAEQSFHQETDVLMLTTNLIRKDLASSNVMEISVALNGLAQVATADLAQDLLDDVLAAMGHSRPYIRKRALVCACRLVIKYPEGLREFVPLLKDRLDDADPTVVASAVGVVCELAHANPQNYLPLAPKLYRLLTTSSNTWMLIKIVKLFAWLTPIEPRLAKKLHGPLSHLVSTTAAMSLLYECINTAVVGGIIDVQLPAVDSVGREMDFAELCARKLQLFYESRDHNLRYVGLVTLAQFQKRRPELVAAHYDTVLRCLDDPDMSIRMRAIEAISGMTTRKTLVGTVKRLMSQLILSNTVALQQANAKPYTMDYSESNDLQAMPLIDASGTSMVTAQGSIVSQRGDADPDVADNPEYRLAVVEAIISMCSHQTYTNLTDFEWYVATLADLVYIAGVDVDERLSERFLDVTVRVRQVRAFSLQMARRLLSNTHLVEQAASVGGQKGSNALMLGTAAYLLGEYCELQPASPDDIRLLLPAGLTKLPADQQGMFVLAAHKVYANWLGHVSEYWNADTWEQVRSVSTHMQQLLSERILGNGTFNGSVASQIALLPLQTSSRVRLLVESLKLVSVTTSNMTETAPPACLELKALFKAYELNPVSAVAQGKVPVPDTLDLDTFIGDAIPDTTSKVMPPPPPPPKQRTMSARQRKEPKANGPYYLPSVDDIPVVELKLDNKHKKSKKKSRRSKHKHRSPSPPPPAPVDIAGDEDIGSTSK
ncbi:AP-3 complex subunit delta [Coemansia sp. RSA 989]|nr:AP-3 complex subunit delta [Coemansia sp. RSA 989]